MYKYKKIVAVSCLPMIAVIVGSFFMFCSEDTPDRCGDGQPLNTYTQFCYGGVTYDKCGGKDYVPSTDFCDVVSGTTYRLCGGKEYLPATEFCTTGIVYSKCGGSVYGPDTEFCDANILYPKCGGQAYAPATEFCFADSNKVYTKCGANEYDPVTEFCDANILYPKCGEHAYAPATEFCFADSSKVYTKCGGNEYDPVTEFCDANNIFPMCNGLRYAPATEFCFADSSKVYTKCGGNEYDPVTEFCDANNIFPMCNGLRYAPATEFCFADSSKVYTKCGGNEYDPVTEFCDANNIFPMCNGLRYAPASQFCLRDTVYNRCNGRTFDPQIEGCVDGVVLPKCGNVHYDTDNEFCHNNIRVVDKCNGATFNADSLFCFNNDLYSLCGDLKRTYNPECQQCDTTTGNIIDSCAIEVWFHVYFEGNGATVGVPGAMRSYPDSVITLPAAMSWTGYTFSGWNTRENGTGTNYPAGASYTVATNDVTLYAIWTPLRFTVTFMGNGSAIGVPEAIDTIYGARITLPDQGDMVHHEGLKFDGWSTVTTSTGDRFGANVSYQVTGNVTLHARWIEESVVLFTVTFDGNGATSGVPTPMSTEQGKSITLPQQGNMTITGYTFSGWSTSRSGGTTHAAGTAYTVTGNDTLYARWLTIFYTIGLGGYYSDAFHSQMFYTVETPTFTLPNPTRTGYTFSGWTGTGVTGQQTTVTIPTGSTGNRTYTANWTRLIGEQFNPNITYGTLNDTRDGKTYRTVLIGGRRWMAENLNYQPSNCPSGSLDSCAKYGGFYTWDDAQSACPAGWSLPSSSAWEALVTRAGGVGEAAGFVLRSQVGWPQNFVPGWNSDGFSALPTGYYREHSHDPPSGPNNHSNWWTTTETNDSATFWNITQNGAGGPHTNSKTSEFSVRCVGEGGDVYVVLWTNVNNPRGGTITRSPNAGAAEGYGMGTEVTVTAIPSPGFVFTGWTGTGVPTQNTTQNPITVTMNSNLSLIANFKIESIKLELIDDFNDGYDIANNGERWQVWTSSGGTSTAFVLNRERVINPAGYAELADVTIIHESWATGNWAQATIALSANRNGIDYDLSSCSRGFRYRYRGNAHRISLEGRISGHDSQFNYYVADPSSDWTTITISPQEFIRSEYDAAFLAGYTSTTLDLSTINRQILWSIVPTGDEVPIVITNGFLQIDDIECLWE